MAEAFSKASSKVQFYKLLQQQGLQLYFRGKAPGIIGTKRRYKLKTLGYSLQRIALLELSHKEKQQQLSRLAQLKSKAPEQDLDIDY
ncbi:hypothetical protein [Winogradskyella haliclonae]|uniref:Uncharacterized protein n=1 Tax=Winogradskyella haliclonae TaxID=2048558 RepID=A0ABQ2C321_9FLAO|nr:hypothetical protein [Winogradskyella haliclonae]GGI58468.1 hypothetical protein GCM10011444_27770 [Winogradskyella haliclonae]